jgi:hypothetical protein
MSSHDEKAQEAFLDYVEAKAYAEATGEFDAAFAAGNAWVRFLNTFLPQEQQMPVRPLPGSNVIPFQRRYEVAR